MQSAQKVCADEPDYSTEILAKYEWEFEGEPRRAISLASDGGVRWSEGEMTVKLLKLSQERLEKAKAILQAAAAARSTLPVTTSGHGFDPADTDCTGDPQAEKLFFTLYSVRTSEGLQPVHRFAYCTIDSWIGSMQSPVFGNLAMEMDKLLAVSAPASLFLKVHGKSIPLAPSAADRKLFSYEEKRANRYPGISSIFGDGRIVANKEGQESVEGQLSCEMTSIVSFYASSFRPSPLVRAHQFQTANLNDGAIGDTLSAFTSGGEVEIYRTIVDQTETPFYGGSSTDDAAVAASDQTRAQLNVRISILGLMNSLFYL